MKLKHDTKTYPPRVKMTVVMREDSSYTVLPIKIDGCLDGDPLNLDLVFPLSIINYLIIKKLLLITSCVVIIIQATLRLEANPLPMDMSHLIDHNCCHLKS